MTNIFDAAREIQDFLMQRKWGFCFIGGLAVQHWGEPRVTQDIDLTVLTGFGREEPYIDAMLDKFPSRIDDARSFAIENRVLLLNSSAGVGIDISLGGLPFEEHVVARAQDVRVTKELSLRICSAEDLIILKAFAARPIDWNDTRTIVARQGVESLDWTYIKQHLTPLVEIKEEPEIMTQLARIFHEFSS